MVTEGLSSFSQQQISKEELSPSKQLLMFMSLSHPPYMGITQYTGLLKENTLWKGSITSFKLCMGILACGFLQKQFRISCRNVCYSHREFVILGCLPRCLFNIMVIVRCYSFESNLSLGLFIKKECNVVLQSSKQEEETFPYEVIIVFTQCIFGARWVVLKKYVKRKESPYRGVGE